VPSDRSESYVNFIIKAINDDKGKGFSAKLRKTDNEDTEYQGWEILSQWLNLEWQAERRAFALIGSSLARIKPAEDGNISVGEGLRLVHLMSKVPTELEKSSSALRLRRILSCKNREELIDILKPVLRLLESKDLVLHHARLLDEVLWFDLDESRERTRARWARDFFNKKEES
jgi:CRISPR system Cascade subunit CasB